MNTVTNARKSRTAPQSPAAPVWPTACPMPTTLGRILGPALRVGEQQREHPPDARRAEDPRDLMRADSPIARPTSLTPPTDGARPVPASPGPASTPIRPIVSPPIVVSLRA